jgi:hypothetical protein
MNKVLTTITKQCYALHKILDRINVNVKGSSSAQELDDIQVYVYVGVNPSVL